MQTLLDVVLFLHLVGFAVLFGGGFVQLGDSVKVINSAMLWGALSLVLSGIGLVGIEEGLDDPVHGGRVAVKFGIALVVALLCWVNRAKRGIPSGLFDAILLLVLADVAVAVTS
jgi:hypothetical protein